MDNHSTTRVDPRVVEVMLPFFTEQYGNAASRSHVFGRVAEEAVDTARGQLAQAIGASKREIIFTSGATESNNLAIKGVAGMFGGQRKHVVTVQTEHRAVLDPCRRLQAEGFDVTFLPVASDGLIDLDQLAAAINDQTILISVMTANNEIGVIQPITEIGRICKQKSVLLHTDATQAIGKIDLDVEAMGIDLLSFSAHKMYGPKGIGALFVRNRNPHVRLRPLMDGGGHERGMRSGTLAVPLIVGFGFACQLSIESKDDEDCRIFNLRERLRQGLIQRIQDCQVNGSLDHRLSGNLNMSFSHVQGEALLMALGNIAVSSGSACTSASIEPSYVLKAIGVPDDLAHGSIRFGLGRFNTEEEVDFVIEDVTRAVGKLRDLNPIWQMRQTSLAKTAGFV